MRGWEERRVKSAASTTAPEISAKAPARIAILRLPMMMGIVVGMRDMPHIGVVDMVLSLGRTPTRRCRGTLGGMNMEGVVVVVQ